MSALFFYIAAAVAVLSTILVITSLRAIHALLYLIVSLLSVSMVFFVIGAPFIAALEVIVYAGAIMVLFIFVIMVLNLGAQAVGEERLLLRPGVWAGPSALLLVLGVELAWIILGGHGGAPVQAGLVFEPKQVGMALLGPYALGVEIASLLLLAGLVGAYHLGRRPRM